MKKLLAFFIGIFLVVNLHSQDTASTKRKKHFELSFGQSLLFISEAKSTSALTKNDVVLPTSSILFLAEFRPQKFIRIPLFFNLATESKQFIINGQLVNERASPTIGTGAIFKLFKIKIDDKSRIEFETGPLVSCLFDKHGAIRIAPVIAGRIKILRGENFVMYLGTSYSFGINALGLLYGTGTSF